MRGSRPSRRGFLAGISALALQATEWPEPELILYNGNILTVDDFQPRAQAVAFTGSRFLAVDDVRHLPIERTMVGGRWVYES